MNRILLAILVLAVLVLLYRKVESRRVPRCHYIYGCGYNNPDWAYWTSRTL